MYIFSPCDEAQKFTAKLCVRACMLGVFVFYMRGFEVPSLATILVYIFVLVTERWRKGRRQGAEEEANGIDPSEKPQAVSVRSS